MPGTDTLAAALAEIVGAEHVLDDPDALALATADLFPFPAAPPAVRVVLPGSADEAARVVRATTGAGCAIVARGAGLSYTGGMACTAPAVVVDTARLDSIEIREDDLYAVVGAGTSWQRLAERLDPLGLRTQLAGPISGAVSTVGGAVSQSVPGSMDGVLGVQVVLADGTVARTGAWARAGGEPFLRHAGPDLTGLFVGDCGAFGVKTTVALRLVPKRPCAFASFAYADSAALVADLLRLQRDGLVSRAMALDRGRAAEAGGVEAAEAARVAAAVAGASGSALSALRNVASMVKGRFELAAARWSLHLTAEGASQPIADAQIALARTVCGPNAREIEDTVPRALHARPFSIRGFVGVDGERWVPVHGMVAPSRAARTLADIDAYLADHADAMQAAGVRHSMLMSSSGAFVNIEPMFLWDDALDPLHLRHLSPKNRERFGARAARPAARALVATLRAGLRELFERHGAVHAQVARYYRHAQRLDPGSRALLERVRHGLDPAGALNPGVLGLGAASED